MPVLVGAGSLGASLVPDPYVLLAVAAAVSARKAVEPLVRGRRWPRLDGVALAGLAGYVAAAAGFALYVAALPEDAPLESAIVVLAAVHVVAGAAIGRWPALFLPLLLVLFTIPIPTPADADEPIPIWFVMLLWVAPVGVVALAAGVAARRLAVRFRQHPA